jgi:hypothetical protein
MPYEPGPESLPRRSVIGLLTAPVVNGHPDGVWSKITAQHLIFGNTAQRLGYALLGYLVSFLDVFTTNHFCRYRRAGDGHRTAHAFEFDVLNHVILDVESDQDRVAVHRTADDGSAGRVRYTAHISRVSIVLANLLTIQSHSVARP